ncbi:TPA: type II toxin-antitoxin system HigB family toxin [Yersinia enterocolitica]|nr:type II toxin-antitoxin system HigB family toxin [Yersinia enterocolitica]
MDVRGLDKLDAFCKAHNQAKGALDAWHDEVKRSSWKTPQDIKNNFASASFLSNRRVVFNIKGNHYRLVVQVIFVAGVVIVDKVGTHAEYDKWRL